MKQNQKGYHCWITNISKNKVIIGDLGLPIAPRQTIDLLDPKRSYFTIEQIEKSVASGSLYKRINQKVIVIRKAVPEKPQERQINVAETSYPYKLLYLMELENPVFEELEFDSTDEADEAFANKNADYVNDERSGIDISKHTNE